MKRTVYLDDTFLTNIKHGETRPPYGQPWTYLLFCRRGQRRFIYTIKKRLKRDADKAVARFARQKHVVVCK